MPIRKEGIPSRSPIFDSSWVEGSVRELLGSAIAIAVDRIELALHVLQFPFGMRAIFSVRTSFKVKSMHLDSEYLTFCTISFALRNVE